MENENQNENENEKSFRLSDRYRKDVKVLLEDFDRLSTQEQVHFCALMAHLIESELHVDDSTLYEQFTLSFYDFKSGLMSQRSLEGLDSLLTDEKMALTQLFFFDKPSYRVFCDYIVTFMFSRIM